MAAKKLVSKSLKGVKPKAKVAAKPVVKKAVKKSPPKPVKKPAVKRAPQPVRKPAKKDCTPVLQMGPVHGSRPGAPNSQLTREEASALTKLRGLRKPSTEVIGGGGAGKAALADMAKSLEFPDDRGPGASAFATDGVIIARAGTGKTFTEVIGVAYVFRDMPTHRRTNAGGTIRTMTLWELVVSELGFEPVPSPEQKAIWDFMCLGPKPKTIRYLAFNNTIVNEFESDYKWLTNAMRDGGVEFSFSTVHSLGYAACRRAYNLKGFGSVSDYRTQDMLSVLWQVDLREVWREKGDTIKAIDTLVGLCKLTMLGEEAGPTAEEVGDMADHYGIALNGDREKTIQDVITLVGQAREVQPGGRIDFDDQVWLPTVNGLPVETFDWVIGDEGQDWNRAQQGIILEASSKGRLIIVGDDRQAIYGFAGADSDSLERMNRCMRARDKVVDTFTLTETRRCGHAIVAEAQQDVPDFRAHPDNPKGLVRRQGSGSFLGEVKEKDMVLCRVNAPLVGYAFKMIKAGRRANIVGRDIGGALKGFIKKSKAPNVSDFLIWLDSYYQREAERLQKRRNPDPEALVTLQDRVECLRIFSDGAITIKELYAAIDEVFRGKQCPQCKKSYDEKTRQCYSCKCQLIKPEGTSFSSVHRAKGLEADRVFIVRPDLMPHPKAVTPMAKRQEYNLRYVARTRAKLELVYVDKEDETDDDGVLLSEKAEEGCNVEGGE
jgi:hypothetical protein